MYLGYDETSNVFKVEEWATGKKYYTADINFHPTNSHTERTQLRANSSFTSMTIGLLTIWFPLMKWMGPPSPQKFSGHV